MIPGNLLLAPVGQASLALSLNDSKDERVQEAREEMLKQLWKEIDDKRDRGK